MEPSSASTTNSPESSSSLTLSSNDLVESFIRDDLTEHVDEILDLIKKGFVRDLLDLEALRKISNMSYDDLPSTVREHFEKHPPLETAFYAWQEKARDRLPSSDESTSQLNESYLTPSTPSPLTFPVPLPASHTKSYQMLRADGFIKITGEFNSFCEHDLVCEGWVQHGEVSEIIFPALGMGVEAMEPTRFMEIDLIAAQCKNLLPSRDGRESYINAFEMGFTDISRIIRPELASRQELGIRVFANSIVRLLMLNGLYLCNKIHHRFENAKRYYTSSYHVDLSAFKHPSFGLCQPDFVARFPDSLGDMGIAIIGNYVGRENDEDFSFHERGKLIDYLTCLLQYIQTDRASAIGFLMDGTRFQFIRARQVNGSYFTFEESKVFPGIGGWQKLFALLSKDYQVIGYEPLMLPDWIVESFMGRGGAGEVYSVVKKDATKKRCVLKKFTFNQTAFQRELFALQQFQQHGLQRYIPILEDHGEFTVTKIPFLVSFPCGNVMSPVNRDSPWVFSTRHMIDLVDLLQVVHQAPINLIHRDIKPQNIFLCNEDVILSDWGLAATRGTTIAWAGTESYADPIYLQNDIDEHTPCPEEDLRSLVRTFFVFYRQIEPTGDPIPFWQTKIRLNDPREIATLLRSNKRKLDRMSSDGQKPEQHQEEKRSIWSQMMMAATDCDYEQLVQLCQTLDDSF